MRIESAAKQLHWSSSSLHLFAQMHFICKCGFAVAHPRFLNTFISLCKRSNTDSLFLILWLPKSTFRAWLTNMPYKSYPVWHSPIYTARSRQDNSYISIYLGCTITQCVQAHLHRSRKWRADTVKMWQMKHITVLTWNKMSRNNKSLVWHSSSPDGSHVYSWNITN